jgi:hypothetical protein
MIRAREEKCVITLSLSLVSSLYRTPSRHICHTKGLRVLRLGGVAASSATELRSETSAAVTAVLSTVDANVLPSMPDGKAQTADREAGADNVQRRLRLSQRQNNQPQEMTMGWGRSVGKRRKALSH